MSRLLIIDDEDVIRMSLRRMFERAGYDVEEADSVEQATALPLDSFDVIVSDLRLPGEQGTAIISHVEQVPVIIMTSYASVRSAVEAMKTGAVDYISKPFDHEEMLLMVERSLKRNQLNRQNAALKNDLQRAFPSAGMIGECRAMASVFDRVNKVARVSMPVLITGEPGTGKELVARAIHDISARSDGPLIVVNCGAIPDGSIEAELFGHERGAVAGSDSRRKGLADAAHGGTLYLSHVCELSETAQARLHRLLEHGEVRALGSSHARRVDVRVIVSCHQNLTELSEKGEFREDLYLGLRSLEIGLPPLRDREKDVVALAEHALKRARKKLNADIEGFTERAITAMQEHRWPGNVRELMNAVERAVILSDDPTIDAGMLGIASVPDPQAPQAPMAASLSLDEYFRFFVVSNQTHMTETELASRLGISRKALWERRQKMDIPRSTNK